MQPSRGKRPRMLSSSQTCSGVPDGHIACLTANSFNFCAGGQLLNYPPQICAPGTICCSSSRVCDYAESCPEVTTLVTILTQALSSSSSTSSSITPSTTTTVSSAATATTSTTGFKTSRIDTATSSVSEPTRIASPPMSSSVTTSATAHNDSSTSISSGTVPQSQSVSTTTDVLSVVRPSIPKPPSPTASISTLLSSTSFSVSQDTVNSISPSTSPAPSSSSMNGQSNSTNPYPILNDNGNTIKIASAVGLFGVLVLGVAGALYWRRLRQGDADNSVEKNDTAGISGGGGQKSDSNGYPLCGGPNSAGGVILINTECSEGKSEISGIAPEFYRDSTGSLKAGERVSHANKQLPPIHTFASASRYANDKPQEASPPTLRPDVNQSKFSLIGGLKDFASLMTSKSLAEGKRSAADNTATTESDLPFGVAPGAENQQKAYNGPRKSKVNSVSDTISIWNLITSYAMFGSKDNHTASSLATDGERGPSHQPQHSKQKNQGKSNLNEESFSESLQSAFSGIYGKYQDEKTAGGATSARISQINSQYDYSMQHTTSPLQPQRDSKVYRPQLRGIPTAVQSQAESSTIEMEDVLQQHEYESGSESEIIEEAVDTEEESSIDLMSPLSERLGSLENQLEGQSEESLDLGSGEFEEDGAQLENEKAAPPLQPKMPAIPGWMRDSTTASTQNQAQEKEKEEVEEIKPKKKREPGWLAEMSSEMPGWMAFEDEASIASPKPLIAANEEIPPSPTLPPPPPPVLSLDTIIQQKEALKKQDDISKGKTPTNEAPKLAHKVLPFTAVSDKGPSKTTKTFETSKEWYQPTHVSRELFFGTRSDEMNMGAGDLIHVDTVYDDGWCRATNLSQGKKVGVVPMRYLKAVKGGIGPSRRIVRLVEDIDTGSSDNQKSDDGISKDNLVWVGALNSNDKRKSTDSMRSIITTSGKNPRVDSLL